MRRRIPDWTRSPAVMFGVITLAVMLAAGFFAPLPYDPNAVDPSVPLQPPSSEHWFGTDNTGADVFSRVVRAGRTDLPVAFAATGASLVIGVLLALLMSIPNRVTEGAMRFTDVFQALPLLILILALVQIGGGGTRMVVLAIMIAAVPQYVRVLRGTLVGLRSRRYVEAARAAGASEWRILRVHLLPNILPVTIVQMSLFLSASILAVAALSFIGIGIQPPTPSWGGIVSLGATGITAGQWWLLAFPGAAIFLAVVAANSIADGLNAQLPGARR